MDKKELRSWAKKKILSVDRQELSRLLAKRLFNYLHQYQDRTIGIFAPMKDEPYWPIDLRYKNFMLAFPRPDRDGLIEFVASDFALLQKKAVFGTTLSVPLSDKIISPQVLVIPGLLFTKSGNRLGRGGGFYDRFLSSFNGIKIGICFADQIIDKIDVEKHDEQMDLVITECDTHIARKHIKE